MRVSKILFIAGLIILIMGIIIAIIAPGAATWEPKSKTLVDRETLAVSAGWKSNSKKLVEEVLSVEPYFKYDAGWGAAPFFFGEEKDFVITGSVVEQSSPQRPFNFYVFDSVNYDLWEKGLAYKAFYEDKGKTSISFTFSIASKEALPSSFYFVVEQHNSGVRPTVLVNSTISWTEKSSKTECSEYASSLPQFLIEDVKDFRLIGNATEANGKKFNFYIMDYSNLLDWLADKSYTALFEQKNVDSVNFDFSLTEDQAKSALYFVAENPLKDVDESIVINAVLKWQEKATISTTLGGWIVGSTIAFIGFIIMIIAGIASIVFKPKKTKGEAYADVVQRRPPSPSYSKPRPRPKPIQQDYAGAEKIYCTYCGAENRAEAKFCRKCGRPMS